MSEVRHHNKAGTRTVALRAAGIVLALTVLAVAGWYLYLDVGANRIARGVKVGSIAIGGMEAAAATELLSDVFADYRLTFELPGFTTTLSPAKAGAVGAGGFASFDAEGTVRNALRIGKGGTPLSAFVLARTAIFGASESDFVQYGMDENALREALEKEMLEKVVQVRDAELVVRAGNGTADPEITIVKERDGVTVDFNEAADITALRLSRLDTDIIALESRKSSPRVTEADILPLKDRISEALNRAPLTLSLKEKSWVLSRSLLADWIVAVPAENGGASLALHSEKVTKSLTARAADLEAVPKDAVFELKNGKVVKFSPSVNGEKLDEAASLAALEEAVFGAEDANGPVKLIMTVAAPEIETGESNDLGIKEIIGVGASNFAGSPRNRRHNIAVGAKAVNGTLVPPGQEFSMLKTLGTIDGSTGYLEELVIKGNETKPEFGGGLCQIGSTAFRGALASGMQITARQNHSYRVPYYERDGDGKYIGPGKDATIYDPAPDFRFLNDTGHHIMILATIEGNKLSFTFWGTPDGRTATQTDARVYNVVQPPEKKIIQTAELPPGQEKCTEKAHMGSDAVFTYAVTYADGTVKSTDFKSHYRPWQEVCLLGVDPALLPIASAGPTIPSLDVAGATGN